MKLVLDNGKEIVLSQELASQLGEVVKKEEVKKTGWERVDKSYHYYRIDPCKITILKDSNDTYDESYYSDANYFSDKELAEKVAFRQTLERKLMRFSAEHDGDKIDWDNTITKKYFIKYDHEKHYLSIDHNYFSNHSGGIYFNTKPMARLAIDTFKDDLIKYFTTMSL